MAGCPRHEELSPLYGRYCSVYSTSFTIMGNVSPGSPFYVNRAAVGFTLVDRFFEL